MTDDYTETILTNAPMSVHRRIPLTWEFGEVIGSAVVYDDGTARISINNAEVAAIIGSKDTLALSLGHTAVVQTRHMKSGSLRERSSGRWQYRVGYGVHADKRPRYRTATIEATSRTAAERKARAIRNEWDKLETAEVEAGRTVAGLAAKWFEWRPKAKKGLSPNTIRRYTTVIAQLTADLGHIKLEALSALDLDHWYISLAQPQKSKRTRSANTVRYYHDVTHAILKQGVKWQMVARNVAEFATPPDATDIDEKSRMPTMAAIEVMLGVASRSVRMAVRLGAATGCRRAEQLASRAAPKEQRTRQGVAHQAAPPRRSRCAVIRVQVHAADMGGCGHYRAIWPATAVHYNDAADVDLVTLEDGDAAAFSVRTDPIASVLARRPILRGELDRIPDADVVVVQRPLTAHLVTAIEGLKAAGIAVVVEVDDDFATIDPRNAAWPTVQPHLEHANGGRSFKHLARACELADLVTVTTPALAARYGRHGRVRIIPNYVPTAYLHVLPPERPPDQLGTRVGWSGNVDTHPFDLQVTGGAVGVILRERELPFYVIGNNDVRVARNLGLSLGTKLAHTAGWLPLAKYPVGMAMLDVGIVPLALTPFNEAKSWLKGLEFAALGVPFVASPTGPYRSLIELGAGTLAAKRADWRRELIRLVDDGDYRAERAADGKRAAARLTIEDHLEEWADAWRHARELATQQRKAHL